MQIVFLTQRERQVLDALMAGKVTKDIASDLDLAPKTIDVFKCKIYDKLQVHSISELFVRMRDNPPDIKIVTAGSNFHDMIHKLELRIAALEAKCL
jgi:DNA-binding NarL/FixJ family response regulator